MKKTLATLAFTCTALVAGAAAAFAAPATPVPALRPAPAAGALRTIPIELSQFGYSNDVSLTGSTPQLEVTIPVYPQLRSVRFHVPVEFSNLVDERSTVVVRVNGQPVFASTVKSLGRRHVLDVPLPIPIGTHNLAVSIGGHFYRDAGRCVPFDNAGLWMHLDRHARLDVQVAAPSHDAYVADFLHSYEGSIAVVVPSTLSEDDRLAALRLAYDLHRTNRWRTQHVLLSGSPLRGMPNVVFATSGPDLQMRGDALYVTRAGIPLLATRVQNLLLARNVTDGTFTASPKPVHGLTFDELGIPTQTVRGEDELAFPVSFKLGRLGGLPVNPHLHLNVTHTPSVPDDRATLNVFLNGTLIASTRMRESGGPESFDVPVDGRLLEASNEIRTVASYFPNRPCDATPATMTASLLSSSGISWDGLSKDAPAVADFMGSVNGNVAVLLADANASNLAFSLLDKLGAENTSIGNIDVKRFDGTIPPGYDYAIVLAPPDAITKLDLAFKPGPQTFVLTGTEHDATTQFQAHYDDPLGVLETTLTSTPALVLTYWAKPAALDSFAGLPSTALSGAQGNVALFNRTGIAYVSERPDRFKETAVTWIRETLILIAVISIAVIAFFLATALWRRRRV